jgi:hypothetical protein
MDKALARQYLKEVLESNSNLTPYAEGRIRICIDMLKDDEAPTPRDRHATQGYKSR